LRDLKVGDSVAVNGVEGVGADLRILARI